MAEETENRGSRAGAADTPNAEEARRRQEQRLKERLRAVGSTVMVLSGKGGVGKSTVAANMAVALAGQGHRVGLLDADMHGPSVPSILALDYGSVGSDGQQIVPARFRDRLGVISIGLLTGGPDEAIIWRGPLKMNVLRQLLADVEWGPLDFLVIDFPPGTGDEPLSVCQLIPDAAGAVVVTTPQELSLSDVRRCIDFCRTLHLPVLGVIENMSGYVCPHCGRQADLFGRGGGQKMARQTGVAFLGRIPIDPAIARACDEGKPFVEEFPDSEATRAFLEAIEPIGALAEP